jgi:NAD(P)-dependent dehydrogenase (short-subunit alcohol dehydrogenase family)
MAGLGQGKIALLAGGGSGIVRATALALDKEGAKVVVFDIVVADGEETVRLIQAAGGKAVFIKADVEKAVEVEALINKVVKTYSEIRLVEMAKLAWQHRQQTHGRDEKHGE